MFTENPMKGVLKCDCCGYEQQVINKYPAIYNFRSMDIARIIQPMLESTKHENYITEIPVKKHICENCYKEIEKTINKLKGNNNLK